MKSKRKINIKVVILSIIAIACLFLTFWVDWLFIIPAAIIVWLNQRELVKDKEDKNTKKK
jgi:hypothetical protein